MKHSKSIIPVAAMFILFSSLVGCVDLRNVKVFATATDNLVTASDRFFESAIETDAALAAANYKLSDSQLNQTVRDRISILNGLRVRQAAVQSLSAYAKSLNDLATLDASDEIESAANALSKSLNGISDGIIKDEPVLASAIKEVALLYVKVQQQNAVRKAVTEAHPHVKIILKVLSTEIRQQRNRLVVARAARDSRRDTLLIDLKENGSNPSKSEQAPPKQAPSKSELALRDIAAGQIVGAHMYDLAQDKYYDDLVEALTAAVSSCEEAHLSLREKKFDPKVIGGFVSDVQRVAKAVDKLR